MSATTRVLRTLLPATLIAGVVSIGVTGPASAAPPGIPDTGTAKSELAALRVAPEGPMTGYDRKEFPHWEPVSGACNTREEVLKRDGTDVKTDAECASVSGKWFSPYDNKTYTAASDIDIDHVVPLAAAWRSGAKAWTKERRTQFANDLGSPQLIAVKDSVNQDKGDKTPDVWKPPTQGYWCTYAKMWTRSKTKWGLTITEAEKGALSSMLGAC
ncbi:HNH endonuclease family protein [Allokutzneria sp. NRRL B-24872]|uniref:HNH endonuclease family protein n=1 Tax=Allokutzneria sp. NRRL B-24872 TaxID=1137961 RepID=UPI001FF02D49|nr:HNH endonuclease family protein [Allokutzneria sp. NRRL B-24872]